MSQAGVEEQLGPRLARALTERAVLETDILSAAEELKVCSKCAMEVVARRRCKRDAHGSRRGESGKVGRETCVAPASSQTPQVPLVAIDVAESGHNSATLQSACCTE